MSTGIVLVFLAIIFCILLLRFVGTLIPHPNVRLIKKKGNKMKKQISRISIAQTSKIITILYVLFSFIYSLIGIPMIIFGGSQVKLMGFIYLFMPILMGVFGFIFVALACWVYNIIASKFGGVEFEVKDIEAEAASNEITA